MRDEETEDAARGPGRQDLRRCCPTSIRRAAPATLRPPRRTPSYPHPEDFRKEDFPSSRLHLLIRPLGKDSSQAAPRTVGAKAAGWSLSLSIRGEGTSRASRQCPHYSPHCSRHPRGVVTNRDEIPAPQAWQSNRADRRSRHTPGRSRPGREQSTKRAEWRLASWGLRKLG